MEEKVSELALSCSQTDYYIEYHHRTFARGQMEIEIETLYLSWSTGLSFQGPVEEQKEGEHEQGSQDHEGLVHPLRQCA